MGGYRIDYAVSSLQLRRRLWQQAHTDALTGLLNRAGWNREAGKAYADAVARGQSVSFVFFDIDFFKSVNDLHGHDAGDRVLQTLGRILAQRIGGGSYCARLGGEEFVVMVVDQQPEQVESFVMRVRAEFEKASEFATRVARTWPCTRPRPRAETASSSAAPGCGRRARRPSRPTFDLRRMG
ncbi:GGDEF domain-containing protein [Lysobacter koreensis]